MSIQPSIVICVVIAGYRTRYHQIRRLHSRWIYQNVHGLHSCRWSYQEITYDPTKSHYCPSYEFRQIKCWLDWCVHHFREWPRSMCFILGMVRNPLLRNPLIFLPSLFSYFSYTCMKYICSPFLNSFYFHDILSLFYFIIFHVPGLPLNK